MSISPAAIAAIRAHVTTWDTQDDEEILATLNGPSIANPEPQQQVPNTCYPSEILSLLSPESLAKVDRSGFASKLYDDLQASNNAGVGRWALYYAGIASISEPEAMAIAGRAQGEQPDPSWPALVSWAFVNIGRPLGLDEIAASRPGA